MEMLVSLSHEIPVDEKAPAGQAVTEGQQRALEREERQRIIDTYGIDATEEEIEKGEKEQKEEQEEQEQNAVKSPGDLGKFKPDENLNAVEIQDRHDNLSSL